MTISEEDKKRLKLIGAIVIVLFVLSLMLKFWLYSIIALSCFVGGFIAGRKSNDSTKSGMFF